GKRLLRLCAAEDRPGAHDRPAGRERIVERELFDDLVRVRHRQRDLHQAHARLAHRPRGLTRDLRATRPDDGDEPILSKYPNQVATECQGTLRDCHLLMLRLSRLFQTLADATETLFT